MALDDIRWQWMAMCDIRWHQMMKDDISWHQMTLDEHGWHQMTTDDISCTHSYWAIENGVMEYCDAGIFEY